MNTPFSSSAAGDPAAPPTPSLASGAAPEPAAARNRPRDRRPQIQTAMDGAIALVAILLVVQMWLLTATLESYLAGHHDAALPGVIFSGLLFAANIALYFFLVGLDARRR